MLQFAKELRLFNLGVCFLHKFLSTTRDIHRTQRRELRWQMVLLLYRPPLLCWSWCRPSPGTSVPETSACTTGPLAVVFALS
jgi:hypothetical protein